MHMNLELIISWKMIEVNMKVCYVMVARHHSYALHLHCQFRSCLFGTFSIPKKKIGP